jgi:acyl-coenzyme A thioesterase PaaI-like protein
MRMLVVAGPDGGDAIGMARRGAQGKGGARATDSDEGSGRLRGSGGAVEPGADKGTMTERPLQADLKPFGEICYGCGQNNPHGMRIQSRWDGDEAVCNWTPQPHHMSAPGILNGGVIATLIDCHSGTAAVAAAYRAEGRPMGSEPNIVMLTASLLVEYLKPTPLAAPVQLRAKVTELTARKAVLDCSLTSGGVETARGHVVMVRPRQ